jgi:hypothetical protein
MKNWFVFLFTLSFFACNHKGTAPDVSRIPVNVNVQRFERDFFSVDSNSISSSMNSLYKKYPEFVPIFFGGVLGLPENNATREEEIKRFMKMNRFIYDSVQLQFKDVSSIKKEFEKSFRFVKYYFPNYKEPKIITLIGPIDAMAKMQNGDYSTDFLGRDFLGIGLQFYLGKNFSVYKVQYFVENVAPPYRSRRFEKNYMVADAMKLVVDDLFPDQSSGKSLIEQIIEKGKQWWMLDKFMPETPDSIKTGYTQGQLDWCKENEGLIWNAIISNTKDLYTKDPTDIQNYIGEGPFTQGMPEISPGNIGPWIGWQIIKKFVAKNSSLKPDEVMHTPAQKILDEAKYRPK